jgi:hypothetical protein
MNDRQVVLFKDGFVAVLPVSLYQGACLTGDPTAYVVFDGRLVWVRPGQSVQWVEA